MNLTEITRAMRKLRVSGTAATLETRIVQAQADHWAPLDLVSALVQDELQRRQDRLLERRVKQAGFRDVGKTLDTFDFDFNRKLDRRLVFELAAGHFIVNHEDALFLGPPGTGKSHLAQAIGHAAIQQGHQVIYREAHALLEELAEATVDGTRKVARDEMPVGMQSHGAQYTDTRTLLRVNEVAQSWIEHGGGACDLIIPPEANTSQLEL